MFNPRPILVLIMIAMLSVSILTSIPNTQAVNIEFTTPLTPEWEYEDDASMIVYAGDYWKKADAIVLDNGGDAMLIRNDVAIHTVDSTKQDMTVTYDDYLLVQNVTSTTHYVELYDWVDDALVLLYEYNTSVSTPAHHMTEWIGGNFITYDDPTVKLFTPKDPVVIPSEGSTHEYTSVNSDSIGKLLSVDSYDDASNTIVVQSYIYNDISATTGLGLRKIYTNNLSVIWQSEINIFDSGVYLKWAVDESYAYANALTGSGECKITAFYLSNGTIAKQSEVIASSGEGAVVLNDNIEDVGLFISPPFYGTFATDDCSITWSTGELIACYAYDGTLLDNGETMFSHMYDAETYSKNNITRYDVDGTVIETLEGDGVDVVMSLPYVAYVGAENFYICGLNGDEHMVIEAYANEYVGEGFTFSWLNNTPSITADKGDSYSYNFNTNDEENTTYALDTDADAWLELDAGTGTVSGTAVAGTYYVNVTADNGTVELYHNYTLTVAMTLNWVDHSPDETADEGDAYSYTFAVDEEDAVFSMVSDTAWLSINETTGVLSGTAEDGEFYVNVSANYDDETIWHNYTLTVANIEIIWLNHSPGASGTNNTTYSYTFSTNKVGEVFAVDTNATWLEINATTGVLSGTAEVGIYYVNVTASFDGEEIYHNYTLTISEPAPPTTRQQAFEMLPELTAVVFLILCIGIFIFLLYGMVGRIEKR